MVTTIRYKFIKADGKFVKEDRIMDYYSSPPTYDDVVFARKIDKKLRKFFDNLVLNLKQKNLLNKKDIDFWYAVGTAVREFIDSDEFKALDIPHYDLANVFYSMESYARVVLGFYKTKIEDKKSFLQNDFLIAYKLAEFPKDYVKKVGGWDVWKMFLSKPVFDRDKQFLEKVLKEYLNTHDQPMTVEKAKAIIKELNEKLKGYDTRFMPVEKLDPIIKEIVNANR